MKTIFSLFLSISLIFIGAGPVAAQEERESYPHLVSETNAKVICRLKPEEAAWLQAQIEEGKIRLARQKDIQAWERLAREKKRPVHDLILDCKRTFVILKPMDLPLEISPDISLTGEVTFILASGVPFPYTQASSPIYDLNTGGWYQGGSYDDGEQQDTGRFPTAPDKPYYPMKEKVAVTYKDAYPHLSTIKGGSPKICQLDSKAAAWLEARIQEGGMRLATKKDIKEWEKQSTVIFPQLNRDYTNCGRVFTILKPMTLPKAMMPSNRPLPLKITFMVDKGVPFPQVESSSHVYDIETGGMYMGGYYYLRSYDQSVGIFPRYDPKIYN